MKSKSGFRQSNRADNESDVSMKVRTLHFKHLTFDIRLSKVRLVNRR